MTTPADHVSADALARDAARLVRVPSITGTERAAAAELVAIARGHGLEAELVEHDLAAVRAAAGYPGEEAPRDELVGAVVTLRGADPAAPRLCLNGHLDVVPPGTEPWAREPWSGAIEDGCVHGRGAADMKGGWWPRCTRSSRWAPRARRCRATSCCRRSPPRRTAASGPSPRCSATRASAPA